MLESTCPSFGKFPHVGGRFPVSLHKYLLLVLVGLLVITAPVSLVVASAPGQDGIETAEEIIQVILILDISDSMKHPILSDDLPQELLSLSDQINTIESDPQLQQLNDAISTLYEDPELLAADSAWQSAVIALDSWLAENEFGDSLESIRTEIGQALSGYGCDASSQFTLQLAISQTLDELDYWIDQSCSSAGIGFQEKQALRDMVPYLGNPDYIPLQEAFIETLMARNDLLVSLGYFDLITQRDQFLSDANYDLLQGNYYAMIDDLGIPRKIDLAKLAARTLLDLSRLDETAGRRVSVVGLVVFSTESALIQELTPDLDAVEGKIIQLTPQFQTNIHAALDDALEELIRHADPALPTVVILLSDGQTNVGPGPDQILEEIPRRANEMDTTICTVGIGPTEAHVDRELLRGLADKTGGEYLFAKKGEELVNFFVACRQGVVGDVEQVAGYVSPGQSSQIAPITVGGNVCELSLALNYITGNPQLGIIAPDGTPVLVGYPDFTLQVGDNISLYTLLEPLEGEWNVTVTSGDAAGEDIFYNIVITSNECKSTPTLVITRTPSPTRTPVPEPGIIEQAAPILPLVILVVVVMGVFIVITLRRK
ncbi:MAG: VWA domain-containing protein [Chloroflexi bacterium]|nr:VWA domain-containing protein [Chloroflexota bacterium]